jgi:hypothetical protein
MNNEIFHGKDKKKRWAAAVKQVSVFRQKTAVSVRFPQQHYSRLFIQTFLLLLHLKFFILRVLIAL